MPQIHIFAVFYPSPGKVEQLRVLLAEQSAQVHAKEDYACQFIVTEQITAETPEFWLFETYVSEEATNRHVNEPHFQQMMANIDIMQLVARKPTVVKTIFVAGFDLDRKLSS